MTDMPAKPETNAFLFFGEGYVHLGPDTTVEDDGTNITVTRSSNGEWLGLCPESMINLAGVKLLLSPIVRELNPLPRGQRIPLTRFAEVR